jgi:GMP synthase-like glutamine amidotransferase
VRVLAFRHVPFEHLGLIADSLCLRGVEVRYCDLYDSAAVPALDAAAGLIFMGGPMSVNDDLPYIRQELSLIEQAVKQSKPVLGVCLGAQLIARAMGARVYRNAVKEIGWYPIAFTGEARRDAIFAGLRHPELVFHWHGETFDLPSGAAHLASSQACRNQAFRCGANVYGLQFHLEVTPEMIADWCLQDANCGDVREIESPIDPNRNAARLAELSRQIFGRWCGLLENVPDGSAGNEPPTLPDPMSHP